MSSISTSIKSLQTKYIGIQSPPVLPMSGSSQHSGKFAESVSSVNFVHYCYENVSGLHSKTFDISNSSSTGIQFKIIIFTETWLYGSVSNGEFFLCK